MPHYRPHSFSTPGHSALTMITSPIDHELTSIGGFETVVYSPTTPKQLAFQAEHEDEPTTPITPSFSPAWPSSPTSSPEPSTPNSSPHASLLSIPATSFSSSTSDSPSSDDRHKTTATPPSLSQWPAPTTTVRPFASILGYELRAPAPLTPSPAQTTTPGLFASINGHSPHPDSDTIETIIPGPCLQCSLLNLPCSATHPTCTRCARNHERDFGGWYGIRDIIEPCLAQRRRTMQEILEGKEMGQMEILCRLEDDGDGTWEQKLEMAAEVSLR